MSEHQFTIRPESISDLPELDGLCARTFGPGRFARSAYRLREGARPVAKLCFTAWAGTRLVGSIRFTNVRIGDAEGAVLLGPLLADPEFAGQGCGQALIAHGLQAARDAGYRLVLLVGDLPYYEKFGFGAVPRGQITFPGPADPARILAVGLDEGALAAFSGVVTTDQALYS